MSSFPSDPSRKQLSPCPLASLPASLRQNKGHLPCLHLVGVLWHLAARAGGGLPRPPFLPCCVLSPARFPVFVPFLPSAPPPLAVCLHSLSIFPLPVVTTPVLSREILPRGLHAAHPHPPKPGAFSSYPHLIAALLPLPPSGSLLGSFLLLSPSDSCPPASSAVWEPPWTLFLVSSSHHPVQPAHL